MADKEDDLAESAARRGGTGTARAAQRQRSKSQAVVSKKKVLADEAKQLDPVKQAVIWVKKAKVGSADWIDKVDENQYWYYRLSKRTQPFGYAAKYVLVFLGFLSPPVPCHGTKQDCKLLDPALYTWGLAGTKFHLVIPYTWMGPAIAILMYAVILFRMWLRRRALAAEYIMKRWHKVTATLVSIGILFGILSIPFPMCGVIELLMRPLIFLSVTKNLRQGIVEIGASIPGSVDVFLCIVLMVGLFSWAGMVVFVGTDEGYADFQSWYDALMNLWTLFTQSNSPAVFVPAFSQHKISFVFFFLYLIMSVFLLNNVLLAKVYDSYKSVVKLRFKNVHENQRIALSKAFALLCGRETGTISHATWIQFLDEYCDPLLGGIQVDSGEEDKSYIHFRINIILKVFNQIDVERMGSLNFDQFKGILVIFFDRDVYIPRQTIAATSRAWMRLQSFFEKGFVICGRTIEWDGCVDSVILVGTALCFMLSINLIDGVSPEAAMRNPACWCLVGFSVFYVISLHLWIAALGFSEFWYSKPLQNPFELFSVYALFIFEAFVICAYCLGWDCKPYFQSFILLNMLRGMRLLQYVRALQDLFAILRQLMPIFKQMLIIFLIINCIFAIIGLYTFGGLIYTSNPLLVGSSFAVSNYWSFNFNDLSASMITLFMLMLGNNWYVSSDAFIRVTGTRWTAAYFILYFIVINVFLVHVLMALILDGTTVMTQHLKELEAETGAGQIQKRQSLLRKAAGEYSAAYMMRKVLNEDGEFFGGNVVDDDDSSSSSDSAGPTANDAKPMRASVG